MSLSTATSLVDIKVQHHTNTICTSEEACISYFCNYLISFVLQLLNLMCDRNILVDSDGQRLDRPNILIIKWSYEIHPSSAHPSRIWHTAMVGAVPAVELSPNHDKETVLTMLDTSNICISIISNTILSNRPHHPNSWRRHQMEAFFVLLALCPVDSPAPSQRGSNAGFDASLMWVRISC